MPGPEPTPPGGWGTIPSFLSDPKSLTRLAMIGVTLLAIIAALVGGIIYMSPK